MIFHILKLKIKTMFSTRNSLQRCLIGSSNILRVSQRTFATDLHSDRKTQLAENALTPELKDHLKNLGIKNPNIIQNPT
tara:strand:- start:343 stop:579 length:237 start_codon:yes stop_codon:yes gene_type:complete